MKAHEKFEDANMALGITQSPLRKKNLLALAKKFDFRNDWSAEAAGVPLAAFNRMTPDAPLSVVANEMIVKLSELYQTGITAFDGDRRSFITWLDTHVIALNGYKPNQFIGSLTGIGIVKELLLRMEYSIPE